MKTTSKIISIILLPVIILLVSCTSEKQTNTEVIVLRDITQTNLAQPNTTEILSLFDITQNKWNGAIFSFQNLSDVSYNELTGAKIQLQNKWFSNELDREKEIKNFNTKISEIITNSEKDTIGRNNSSIYLPLIEKLNQLSQSRAEKRILLVYSDLMENTKEISFYNKKTMELLKVNDDSLKTALEKLQKLQNLKGIEVHFVFEPTNAENDTNFKTVVTFYKKLLEDKGATINIGANLNL